MHTTEFPLTSRLIPPSQELPLRKGGECPLLKTSPASIPEPPAAERGWEPFQRLSSSHGVSPKELDKLARNIPTFTPNPAGGHDVHAYLKDIDFHLQTVANATARDRLYLLRITSSREVRSFLDRQPEMVKVDCQQLQQALIKEFSDPESEQGLITAMDLKQGRQETTQAYYNRLRQAYFGARNEPGMEDDFNFKTLFLRNLHPTVSHHLGVLACPRTMSTQQLRDLAHKAYSKQRTAAGKTGKRPTICPVANQSSELALEGAGPSHSDQPVNTMARSFPASREQRGHGGARPKHQTGHTERSWNRSQPPLNRKGGATWEARRRPKGNRHSAAQASSSECQQQNSSQHTLDKPKYKLSAEQNREATSESAAIMRLLKELLQKKHYKGDKRDESD
uniref:Retrotransposon gag domain-containing protein n=1 Tax=Cyprinus carpio TaxID=7962 RepID=A0A8C2PSI4_CYPCA